MVTRFASAVWHLLPMPARTALWQLVEHAYGRIVALFDRICDAWYGIHTCIVPSSDSEGAIPTRFQDPTAAIPTPYAWLFRLRRFLRPSASDVFVDLGCGSGRAVFVFARAPVARAAGIEFSSHALRACESNLASARQTAAPIRFQHMDAGTFQFADETIVYLFNPFGAATLGAVMGHLRRSVLANPRKVTVCYYNPVHADALEGETWLRKRHILRNFKGCLYVYESVAA
jgi:SAM-dependent methyltransferase